MGLTMRLEECELRECRAYKKKFCDCAAKCSANAYSKRDARSRIEKQSPTEGTEQLSYSVLNAKRFRLPTAKRFSQGDD